MITAPEGTTRLDARGMTLMPGLIDCHVHTVASSFNLGTVAKWPNVFVMLRALPILTGMLARGFTIEQIEASYEITILPQDRPQIAAAAE